MYLGRPGKQVAKKSLHYWIRNHKKVVTNKSVKKRYVRRGADLGGSEKFNLQPTKNRIETGIKSY